MKKIMQLIAALPLALTLAGCGTVMDQQLAGNLAQMWGSSAQANTVPVETQSQEGASARSERRRARASSQGVQAHQNYRQNTGNHAPSPKRKYKSRNGQPRGKTQK